MIRLPLALLFAGLGLFAALVPVGGRPFDKWIVAFIKAILSPTQRIWIKEEKLPEFLSVVTSRPQSMENIPQAITNQSKQRLIEYLRSLPKKSQTSLDVKEEVSLQRLGLEAPIQRDASGMLLAQAQGTMPPPIIWPTKTYPQAPLYFGQSLPQINTPTGLRDVKTDSEEEYAPKMKQSLPNIQTPQKTAAAPRVSSHAKPYILHGVEKKLDLPINKQRTIEFIKTPFPISPKAHLASETGLAGQFIIPLRTPEKIIKFIASVGKTRVRKLHFAPPNGYNLANLPIRGESRFEISEALKKRFEEDEHLPFLEPEKEKPAPPPKTSPPPVVPIFKPAQYQKPQPNIEKPKTIPRANTFIPKPSAGLQTAHDVSLKHKKRELIDSQLSVGLHKTAISPLANLELAKAQMVPLTNRPNVLSGLVLLADGSPVEGAIIIVRDSDGIPQRAMKTNKLGQFLSATSLANGQYILEVESRQAVFAPITMKLKGEVLFPMEVKSKGISNIPEGDR